MTDKCDGGWGTIQFKGITTGHPPVTWDLKAVENGVAVYVCRVCGNHKVEWESDGTQA